MNVARIALLTAVLTCTQACAQSAPPAPAAKTAQAPAVKSSGNDAAVRAGEVAIVFQFGQLIA